MGAELFHADGQTDRHDEAMIPSSLLLTVLHSVSLIRNVGGWKPFLTLLTY